MCADSNADRAKLMIKSELSSEKRDTYARLNFTSKHRQSKSNLFTENISGRKVFDYLSILHCILGSPFPCGAIMPRSIILQQLCDVRYKRVIRVRVG